MKFSLFFVIVVLSSVLTVSGCGKKDSIGNLSQNSGASSEASAIASAPETRNLAQLMKHYAKATVSPQPWVGYWWPYTGAGIASTWRDPNGLSPADKYDIAYLRYMRAHGEDISKFKSLAAWERERHGPGLLNLESWWGHCNGWSAAAVMVPEPRAPKMIEGVEFDVRDQKALLAESWMEFSGDFVGHRVDDPGDFSSAAFWDVVPAQFQLILMNIVGRQDRGIIIDRHTGYQIWNQPLVGYAFDPVRPKDYLGALPAYPDIYRVEMTAHIWWANDNVGPDEITPKFDLKRMLSKGLYWNHFFPGRVLHYELWLDGPVKFDSKGNMVSSGNILVTHEDGRYVGGVWKDGNDPALLIQSHPDYMWMPFGVEASTGYKNPRIDDEWVKRFIASPRRMTPRGS